MIDIGNIVALVAVSFGLGVFWYEFLRRPQKDRLKLTAISFVGVLLGESLVSAGMIGGPVAYGLHPVTALVASFAAIYLHTAWAEKKIWPWDIISDLRAVKGVFRSVPGLKVSLDSDNKQTDAQAQPVAKARKAA